LAFFIISVKYDIDTIVETSNVNYVFIYIHNLSCFFTESVIGTITNSAKKQVRVCYIFNQQIVISDSRFSDNLLSSQCK